MAVEPAEVYLISGIPGAGKTTVSRKLAERFGRSAHLEGDVIGYRLIVRGLVLPADEPRDEADRQLRLRRKHMSLLANSFSNDGFVTVVDDVVVSPAVLDEEFADLRRPIRFVQLTPRLEVVESRDAQRNKHFFHLYKHMDGDMRSWPEPRPGLWLDSSDMSADRTVDEIFRRMEEAIVP